MEKESWNKYKNRLIFYGYNEEQLQEVEKVREHLDYCPNEQFKELVAQGVVVRTRKIRKPRNYYVNDEGQFLYLEHYEKKYCYAGFFAENKEE